ncbi:MAG: ABC transporter permease [Bacteroidota bacterium]
MKRFPGIGLFRESVIMALSSLVTNKLRSILSVLGIAIGIFCIVLVFTIVDSLETNIRSSVQSLGKNVIYIDKWQWLSGGNDYPWWKYVNRPDIKMDEVRQVKNQPINGMIDAISFTASESSTVKAGKNSIEGASIDGYTSEFAKIQNLDILMGRFFNELEDRSGAPVAVVGANIATSLFPDKEIVVGEKISVFGKQVLIIGQMKNQGDNIINIDFDDNILVPVKFLQYAAGVGENMGSKMIIKAKDNVSVDALTEELRGTMRGIRRLKPIEDDNFSLNKISFLSDSIGEFFKSVSTFGLIIGMFSLLVGGFGVANIMFVSVKERTGQIGIQKSLGAKNEFILFQFLTEAIVLSIIGGLIGIGITWLVSVGANYYLANSMESTFRMALTSSNFINGILFATSIGLFAGIIPAYRASRLLPVEAIRSK